MTELLERPCQIVANGDQVAIGRPKPATSSDGNVSGRRSTAVAEKGPANGPQRLCRPLESVLLNRQVQIGCVSRWHIGIGRHPSGDGDLDPCGLDHAGSIRPPFRRWSLPPHQLVELAPGPRSRPTSREAQHGAASGNALVSGRHDGSGCRTRHFTSIERDWRGASQRDQAGRSGQGWAGRLGTRAEAHSPLRPGRRANVGSPPDGRDPTAASWYGGQRTLYRSSGLFTLFALYGVGFACARTYHWPDDVNRNVVRASPALSMNTSRDVTNRQAPELKR